MLVLSRKQDQSVIVTVPPSDKPTTIKVTLSELKKSRITLAFDAPKTTHIIREELE